MQVVVLGAGAGGGFPQWNSAAPACRRARAGDPLARPCTQTSIAVSADGAHWFVLNASPDLRRQIECTEELHPRVAPRSTPIAGVVLTGGEVDAIAGLLTLRERQCFGLFATAQTHARLDANPIFDVLARDVVDRVSLVPERPCALTLPADDRSGPAGDRSGPAGDRSGPAGGRSGLIVTPFAVPGKVPLYAEADGEQPMRDGETIGLDISDGRVRLLFVPACAAVQPNLRRRMQGAQCLFFDATLWCDDEMILAGLGPKTGRRMGHMPVSGVDGVMESFRDSVCARKILIHINNSNPLLLADSAERRIVVECGWDVAYDGMRLTL